jgi:hypothetical protein
MRKIFENDFVKISVPEQQAINNNCFIKLKYLKSSGYWIPFTYIPVGDIALDDYNNCCDILENIIREETKPKIRLKENNIVTNLREEQCCHTKLARTARCAGNDIKRVFRK